MEAIAPIPTRGEAAAYTSGWSRLESAKGPPSFVAITDSAGTVRGLGSFTRTRDARWSGGIQRHRWRGFIADFDASERYRAYAVVTEGALACRLRGRR